MIYDPTWPRDGWPLWCFGGLLWTSELAQPPHSSAYRHSLKFSLPLHQPSPPLSPLSILLHMAIYSQWMVGVSERQGGVKKVCYLLIGAQFVCISHFLPVFLSLPFFVWTYFTYGKHIHFNFELLSFLHTSWFFIFLSPFPNVSSSSLCYFTSYLLLLKSTCLIKFFSLKFHALILAPFSPSLHSYFLFFNRSSGLYC